jgi:hypothetical protein
MACCRFSNAAHVLRMTHDSSASPAFSLILAASISAQGVLRRPQSQRCPSNAGSTRRVPPLRATELMAVWFKRPRQPRHLTDHSEMPRSTSPCLPEAMRWRTGARHQGNPGMARPSVDHVDGGLYGAVAE